MDSQIYMLLAQAEQLKSKKNNKKILTLIWKLILLLIKRR